MEGELMKRFELYHPIMTKRYNLDWLNKFTVKEINPLRANQDVALSAGRTADFDLEATVKFIQDAMRQVMSDQSLIWGIAERSSKEFLGEFALLNYDAEERTMELHYELLPAAQNHGVMTEILKHMIEFSFKELGLQYLKAVTPINNVVAQHQLEQLGFARTIQTKQSIHYRLYSTEQ